MKNVLIFGKNSYIGDSFVENVRGNEDIKTTVVSSRGDEWKCLDLSIYDCVLCVAGIAHIKETKKNKDLYQKINCDLAINMAELAKKAGVKHFIYISTMAVYGMITGEIDENTKMEPKTYYGKSKLNAEIKLANLADENFKILFIRPPMVYGKGAKGNFIKMINFASKIKIFPNVENKRSMIHINNLSNALEFAIKNQVVGVFAPQNVEYVNTSNLVYTYHYLANKKCTKTKFFNLGLKMISFLSVYKKVFGNLTYKKNMYGILDEYYNILSFEETIKKSI